MARVTAAFDTLKAATQLQEAGFEEDKARALVSTFAQGMVENLATKQDLAALATKEELASLRGELGLLRAEVATLATREELTGLRSHMDQTATSLRAEISKVQERMTVRMGTAIAAAVAILVTVDKLL